MGFNWMDAEEIAARLYELHPDQDPLALRFTRLRDMVCMLEDFDDDPKACSEGKLEAIQMAWLAEYEEADD